ncbi:hypothetical protein C4D60_Mb06t09620 [Musa balbisiana]|uniref:Uncharacterized protein n=1 Tax=Musa balbisiana TaxID=52838 RepID=A0A4S8ILT1_MUSBA|nr:hypothetical protein C4D60_Mb06t09620 [Musa balbisiana]
MSLWTCQKAPGAIGSGVVVRRISAPPSQMAAIRSFWASEAEPESSRMTRDQGAGQFNGGL